MATRADPFTVKLSPAAESELAEWLAWQIQEADAARTTLLQDTRYFWTLYEQGRTRSLSKNIPWTDAADLTSYLGTQYVDAIHARTMRAIFGVEPIWTVEGFGGSAARVPIVEEFTQWKAEEGRIQSTADKWVLNGLIDPMAILEVVEATERRPVRREQRYRVQRDLETGGPQLDQDGAPILARTDSGAFIEADEESGEPTVLVTTDAWEPVRIGPQERVIRYEDFLVLPGHAEDRSQVWGYAKRFYRRLQELRERQAAGLYQHVEELGEHDERETRTQDTDYGLALQTQMGSTAEKQLHEVLFLKALKDGEPARWYVGTLHLATRRLLRLQVDDLGAGRYILWSAFPRPNSLHGYSVIGHKLITLIEEHTAWRNLNTDRAALAAQVPLKVRVGSLWDPDEQPIGVGTILLVNSHDEIQPLQIPDLPQGALLRERMVEGGAERVVGLNDIGTGVNPQEDRTLGENRLVTMNSEIRMAVIVNRLQEALEEWAQVRHAIWLRALRSRPEGLPIAQSMADALTMRGSEAPTERITAEVLEGTFRFKPRGSVETADLNRQRLDFNQFLHALALLMRGFPALQQVLQRPEAARALLEHAVRVYRIPGRQALLGSASQPGTMSMLGTLPPGVMPAMPGAGASMGGATSAGNPLDLLTTLLAQRAPGGGAPMSSGGFA